VRLGRGRLARAYRAVPDLHFLRHFLPRQEQLAAFHDLLNDPGQHWALHYLGVGGVGKTMLLRHISAELSERLGLAVSRIDFDHISPDYPARRPAQLLVELADQFRPYLSTTREEAVLSDVVPESAHLEELALSGQFSFTDLFRQAEDAQEQLPEGAVPADILLAGPLGKVLRAFTDLLRLLEGQGRRPVLILDTCEELSKIREDGTTPPSVAATFSMLGAVQQLVPAVRVIFAGRRLLARSGYDWEVEDAAAPDAPSQYLVKREQLRLHVLRGFDRTEAVTYLEKRYSVEKGEVPPSGEMLEAVLGRCREATVPTGIRWGDGQQAAETTRYNPFDLDLYAQLLLEEGRLPPGERKLTPSVIASGKSDPYVEARIIRRIERDDVRRLLPAVVLLRRFDEEMIRPALEAVGPSAQEAFLELSRQEWLHSSRDNALNTRFFEVDRNLRPRLDRYFAQDAQRAAVEGARTLLAKHLAALVRELPLRRLSVSHVEAALRLLPTEEAAVLWEEIAARPATEADWNWMRRVAGRLLGEGGVAGLPEDGAPASEADSTRFKALRAAVRAEHTASMLHQGVTADFIAAWGDVERHAADAPDAGTREWLLLRASAGELAAALRAGLWAVKGTLDRFDKLLRQSSRGDGPPVRGWDEAARREQVAASLVAALEAFVEWAEAADEGRPAPNAKSVVRWVDAVIERGISAELSSFALVLAARTLLLKPGSEEEAYSRLVRALELAEQAQKSGRGAWADWAAPAPVADRVRLEALLRLPRPLPAGAEAARSGWLEQSRKRLGQIDGERLTSLLLRRSLDERPLGREVLDSLAAEESYRPARQPVCHAHRAVPPLLVTLALGRLALGEADAALSLLNDRIREARRNPRDTTTIREAEIAKLRVIRRMRMPGHGLALIERSVQREPEEQAAAWAVSALRGQYVEKSAQSNAASYPATMVHAWLSTEAALRHSEAADVLGVFHNLVSKADARDDFERLSLVLDWREAMLLVGRFPDLGFRLPSPPSEVRRFDTEAWLREHPGRVEEALRLYVRSAALFDLPVEPEPWQARAGGRRFAEVALEEGELLALRLPERATKLLEAGCLRFIQIEDRAGNFISSVRCVIALAHAGSAERAREVLAQQVRPAYTRLLEAMPGPSAAPLPTWEELSAWSRKPGAASLERLAHKDWAGWLHRLFCCLMWDAAVEGPLQKQVADSLAEAYGTPPPAELDLDRAKGEAAATTARSTAEGDDRAFIRISVADDAFKNRPPSPDAVVPVIIDLLTPGSAFRVNVLSPGLRTPGSVARELPPALSRELATLGESAADSHPIALHVALEVAAAPWEAVFQLAMPEGEPLRWYRSGPSLRYRPKSSASDLLGVEVLCDPAWGRAAMTGWGPLGVRVNVSADLQETLHRLSGYIPPANRKNPARPPRHVLHLIGRPLRTNRGLSLQIRTGAARKDVAQERSDYSSRGEMVVSPDDLPLEAAALVVLQGEPAETYGGLSSEQEMTGDLRVLANELFTAGAHAVIMLPTLPAKLAQSALEEMARGVGGRAPWGLHELLQAVTAARHAIAESSAVEDKQSLVEAALGVTLFAQP
jgi:hypothetical protein